MTLDDWLAHQQLQHPDAIALGLDRVRTVAQRLGLTRPATHVITVAGTNGKGSTVAFIEAIARAAGLRVGAYTSPHLLRYNERVRVDGADATDAALVAAFERVENARLSPSPDGAKRSASEPLVRATMSAPAPSVGAGVRVGVRGERSDAISDRAGIPLTYFEYGTLAALLLFERTPLDLAILEVGLGGRLDAVNIVDADVAVITTVDLDHQDWLGADRETIGLEKAGVMRAGKPVVLGELDPPASVLKHAYRIGASAIRAGCDYLVEPLPDGWRWREPGYAIDLPEPELAAPVQRANAAAAIAALRALDLAVSQAAIIDGVCAARLPARLQRFLRNDVEIVIDVAHNPQAARVLAGWLSAHPAAGRTVAVFSALGDKDLTGIVAPLVGHIAHWWLCGLHDTSRGLTGVALGERLSELLVDRQFNVLEDVEQALRVARGAAQAGDRVLVFGSFHTAADALRALEAN
ncbi:MAG TPA: folylpolyglutamate synthase/dihydrofolate synthase family protein [Xanthomonadaceae bacterium]|jgi:dihydrofolate synthase/folylpolyglutamate synthase|nr:folylpolyglutamate synthase/dihydrofolate synthase family protein [Xanthomonadaceae bacterium]